MLFALPNRDQGLFLLSPSPCRWRNSGEEALGVRSLFMWFGVSLDVSNLQMSVTGTGFLGWGFFNKLFEIKCKCGPALLCAGWNGSGGSDTADLEL